MYDRYGKSEHIRTKLGVVSAVPEIWLVPTKILNGSRDLITPLSAIVCHPWTRTCYDQSIYQI